MATVTIASERAGCALSILAYQTSCFCFRGDNSLTRCLGLARLKSPTWKVHQRNLRFPYSDRIFLNSDGYPRKQQFFITQNILHKKEKMEAHFAFLCKFLSFSYIHRVKNFERNGDKYLKKYGR